MNNEANDEKDLVLVSKRYWRFTIFYSFFTVVSIVMLVVIGFLSVECFKWSSDKEVAKIQVKQLLDQIEKLKEESTSLAQSCAKSALIVESLPKLQEQYSTMENTLSKMQDDNSSLIREIASRQEVVKKLTEEGEQREKYNKELNDTIATLEKQKANLEDAVKQLPFIEEQINNGKKNLAEVTALLRPNKIKMRLNNHDWINYCKINVQKLKHRKRNWLIWM